MEGQDQITKPLPLEVTSKILSMLTFREKLEARLVCNYWRTILDTFGKYFRLTIKDDSLVDFLFNMFSDLESLHLDGVTKQISSTRSRNKFPRIRRLSLGNQNSGPTVLSFLKYGLVFAKELKIEAFAFQNLLTSQIAGVVREVKWEHLLQFEFKIITTDGKMKLSKKQVAIMSSFLELAHIPYLKELRMIMDYKRDLGDDGSLIKKLGSNIYKFIARHSTTVKGLSWTLRTEVPDGLFVSPIPNEIMERMRSNLKLKSCKIVMESYHNSFALVLPSFCDSDSLTSLTVEIEEVFLGVTQLAPEFSGPVDQVLQRNKETLTDLTIGVSETFDMNLLWNCHKLKSLMVFIGGPEIRVINPSSNTINFPELKSFELFAFSFDSINFPENFSFETWIVERMPMVEEIKFTTYYRILTTSALQTLVNGLHRLKEIKVQYDALKWHMIDKLDTYCNETEGLTFVNIGNTHSNPVLAYVIKIDR